MYVQNLKLCGISKKVSRKLCQLVVVKSPARSPQGEYGKTHWYQLLDMLKCVQANVLCIPFYRHSLEQRR